MIKSKNITEPHILAIAMLNNTTTRVQAQAQMMARTTSQRHAGVLVKAGQGHMFAAAMSSKHAKQILKTSVADVFAAAKAATGSKMRAVGYAAEAVAAKVAAGATIALKAALDFLCANVFMVALLAIAGAIALLNHATEKAAKAMNKLANEHRIAAEHAKEETESTRKVIQSEQEQIQYLVDLEKQGNATREQQEAALSIIEALEKRYKNLGITIDTLTGQLTGALAAQRRLNEEQKKALQEKLKEQLTQEQQTAKASMKGQGANAIKNSGFMARNFTDDSVDDEHAEFLKKMGFEFHNAVYETVSGPHGPMVVMKKAAEWVNTSLDDIENMSDEKLKEVRKRVQEAFDFASARDWDTSKPKELLDMLDNILNTRQQLAQTEEGNLTGEEQKPNRPVVQAPDQTEIENAKKKLADMDEKNSQKRMASLDRETSAIQKQCDEYQKYLNLLEQEADIKRQQAEINRDDTTARIEETRKKIQELQDDNEGGKNDEEITRLNSSMKELASRVNKYIADIAEQDKVLERIASQRSAAIGENWKTIRANEKAIAELSKNGEDSKNSEEIKRLTEENERLRADIGGEYGRQLQLAQDEDAKRQKREIENNRKLVNNWTDAQGKQHRGTLYETQAKQLSERRENDRFQQLMGDKNFAGAMRMIKDLFASNSASMREATKAYNDLLDQAEKNGYYDGTMSEQDKANTSAEISRLASILQEGANREMQLRQKYDEVRKAARSADADRKSSSIGSFSASALSRAIGSDGTQLKMLKTSDEQKKILGVVSTNLSLALIQIRELNQRLGIVGG